MCAGEGGGVRVVCGRCADLFELYCIWIMAFYIIDIRKKYGGGLTD